MALATVGCVLMCAFHAVPAPEDLHVLPDTLNGAPKGDMMRQYLLGHVNDAWERWKADYERRTTPEAIAAYQSRLRELFVAKLGGFPERTPLNARITDTIQRDGYRVEKVIFESRPQFFVTALFFVPERFEPPFPGVLVPCGHAQPAKGHEEYQSVGALLALNGMAALVFDPIEQGERMQLAGADGTFPIWGTNAHTQVGIGSILLGRNTAAFEVWDGMRGIDYLQSRPEIDPERIGCTGNSGGGTQTSYLMALDGRIKVAAPSCYLSYQARQLDSAPGDAEQNIHGQLSLGLDHPDFIMMRAPRPVKLLAATRDFFEIEATWETFRYAKRLYTRIGASEKIDILENDEGHNYNQTQREGAVRWLARWLLGNDAPIEEPELQLLSEEEYRCTPKGQVILLEGARTTYDINRDYEEELTEARTTMWKDLGVEEMLERVRATAGIRRLSDLPASLVETIAESQGEGYLLRKIVIRPENGVSLPALLFLPEGASGTPVLYADGNGKGASVEAIMSLVASGRPVLAVDVRGTGETEQVNQTAMGPDIGLAWEDFFRAYALGKSYVGMRAEDILVSARWLSLSVGTGLPVEAVGVGSVGVSTLHAAALEPGLFAHVTLRNSLVSWHDVVMHNATKGQLMNAVHGALCVYDFPDLVSVLKERITVVTPANALGEPAG